MRVAVLALCGTLLWPAASATTYLVRPDGSGDFPTIQAAIDAANDGDVIDLADGTFLGEGNRDLDYHGKAITVRSLGGDADFCRIDCSGSPMEPHRGFNFHSGETAASRLEAVTVVNGNANGSGIDACGGAILCKGSSPTVTRCTLDQNYAHRNGGGIAVYDGSPTIMECTFRGNIAPLGGGIELWGGSAYLPDCWFESNYAMGKGGGVYCTTGCTAELTRCTFSQNMAGEKGGAIVCNACVPVFSQCTFFDNQAGAGCQVWTLNGAVASLDHAILAFGWDGAAFFCETGGAATLSCCDVYGNLGGDFTDCIAEQEHTNGNLSADPLFCDPAGADFTLQEASPCGPEHDPACGVIGAWPVGCGGTPVEQTTWGALKSLFR